MKFLAPVGGKTTAYGIITAPTHRGIPGDIVRGKPWAGDLGCLTGPDFVKKIDLNRVAEWLPLMLLYKARCLFLSGGDIVFDAAATLETYAEFKYYFTDWPLAYVAQNGSENLPFPDDCSAIFIGGDTKWKCSMAAVSVIKRAQKAGLHIHIGRVNWGARYRLFRVLEGSEDFTCDGTRVRYEGTEKTLKAYREYESLIPLLTI